MNHSFDIDIAVKYGVNAAVLLNNIYFWCEHNQANGTNFHDGYYWTYNSRKAFSELFPYMTQKAVATALQKLIDDGILITGNYNVSAYDRTMWYAVTEKGKCIIQKGKMEDTEKGNAKVENVTPIPDIKPDMKPDKNTYTQEFDEIWKMYPKKQGKTDACKAYVNARKKGTNKEQIIDGLNRYIQYIKESETPDQYIKHGSTWFHQECWNDEYKAVRKSESKNMMQHDWDFEELESVAAQKNFV